MFYGIIQCLLGDTVKMGRGSVITQEDRGIVFEGAGDPEEPFHVRRQFYKRHHETVGFEPDGVETPGEAPGQGYRLVDEVHYFGDIFGPDWLLDSGPSFQHLAHETDPREMLAQTVVKVLTYPALFTSADLEYLSFQSFAPRCVAHNAQRLVGTAPHDPDLEVPCFPAEGKVLFEDLRLTRRDGLSYTGHDLVEKPSRKEFLTIGYEIHALPDKPLGNALQNREITGVETEQDPRYIHLEHEVGNGHKQSAHFRFALFQGLLSQNALDDLADARRYGIDETPFLLEERPLVGRLSPFPVEHLQEAGILPVNDYPLGLLPPRLPETTAHKYTVAKHDTAHGDVGILPGVRCYVDGLLQDLVQGRPLLLDDPRYHVKAIELLDPLVELVGPLLQLPLRDLVLPVPFREIPDLLLRTPEGEGEGPVSRIPACGPFLAIFRYPGMHGGVIIS
ncbi:MAG: hypothetical protein A4E61_01962 [Syntrophorhabdus sp. PtaB.Bin184]|nr:MAG: hypothetical protein A4E61_01962 [Syntrophorhabdus sp. PtaB.Bin184]